MSNKISPQETKERVTAALIAVGAQRDINAAVDVLLPSSDVLSGQHKITYLCDVVGLLLKTVEGLVNKDTP